MSNPNYNFNREPLMNNKQTTLPLCSVKPKGWLLNQLLIQSKGLTGHLDEFWDSVGSYSGWLGGTGENWERGPYYCDGLVPLAYLLNDENLINKSKKWIEWTLKSQTEDGNFGPENNQDWWPRMVMLKVLIQYFEITSDKRIIELMTKYFTYQNQHIEETPLISWGKARGGELIYCIHWLYNQTGDKFLLILSEKIFKQTLDWTDIFNNFPFVKPTNFYYKWDSSFSANNDFMQNYLQTHIVNITMGIKEPGLYYRQSKDEKHKEAVVNAINSLTKYHGFPTGIFSGDEHLSGNNPTQGSELCSVVEYMFSLQTLLEVEPDVKIADILEKVAFNALPATITKDFWGHQYVQQANQIMITNGKRNWYNNNHEANLMGLEPNFGCCTANMHQGWPKFIKNLWMATDDCGLAAVVYSPCTVNAIVADNVKISLEEETNYPFDENIKIKVRCNENAKFPLKFRIPCWCSCAKIEVNGEELANPEKGTYYTINREWKDNDTITITLPMEIKTSYWYNNSIAIERGPLVYSLRIGEKWKKLKGVDPYADWEVYPTTPWNYALKNDNINKSFSVIKNKIEFQPFDSLKSPIVIKAEARKVKEWGIEDNSAGDVPISPITSNETEEEIELIPYGAAKLRITQFPYYY